jgi:hypothetical protein
MWLKHLSCLLIVKVQMSSPKLFVASNCQIIMNVSCIPVPHLNFYRPMLFLPQYFINFESVKRDLKDWCITKELALDRREEKLAIHVKEP